MANTSGNAYALSLLCPIKPGTSEYERDSGRSAQSYASDLRNHLETLPLHECSPFAKVPNTYTARLFVLGDVLYQGKPAIHEHLRSQYLVFTSNFHGKLNPYLEGMWDGMKKEIPEIWGRCIGFEGVNDSRSFIQYMKKCQVKTTFFFMGSTDVSQAEQLKALYLKQEFSKFASDNQGKTPAEIQAAFKQFINDAKPRDLSGPTRRSGQSEP